MFGDADQDLAELIVRNHSDEFCRPHPGVDDTGAGGVLERYGNALKRCATRCGLGCGLSLMVAIIP